MKIENKLRKIVFMILLVLCVWIVVAEEITVQLHKGWNVLPVPLELESKDPKDVFGEDLNKVLIIRKYQADGVKVYDPAIPERFNTFTELEPKYSYQIKMTHDATLTLRGSKVIDPTFSLHEFWNCFTYLGDKPMQMKDVFEGVEDKIDIIREYAEDGVKVYDPTIPERFNTLMTAKPNTGYQLKARGEAQLNYLPTLFKKNNIRDMDKYYEKELFLIPQGDIKNILQLVPLTVWRDDNSHNYPSLMYNYDLYSNLFSSINLRPQPIITVYKSEISTEGLSAEVTKGEMYKGVSSSKKIRFSADGMENMNSEFTNKLEEYCKGLYTDPDNPEQGVAIANCFMNHFLSGADIMTGKEHVDIDHNIEIQEIDLTFNELEIGQKITVDVVAKNPYPFDIVLNYIQLSFQELGKYFDSKRKKQENIAMEIGEEKTFTFEFEFNGELIEEPEESEEVENDEEVEEEPKVTLESSGFSEGSIGFDEQGTMNVIVKNPFDYKVNVYDLKVELSDELKPYFEPDEITKNVILEANEEKTVEFKFRYSNLKTELNEGLKINNYEFSPDSVDVGQEVIVNAILKNELPYEVKYNNIKFVIPEELKPNFEPDEITMENIVIGINEEKEVPLTFTYEVLRELEISEEEDPTLNFVDEYVTEENKNSYRITVIDDITSSLNARLSTRVDNTQSIEASDYLSYWDTIHDVVYVEEDYDKMMLATRYAAFINAPLIIKDFDWDNEANFEGKNVICIETEEEFCSENLEVNEVNEYLKYVGYSVDLSLFDNDGDDVSDLVDNCLNTPEGEIVSEKGCSCSQLNTNDYNLCTEDACEDGIVTNTPIPDKTVELPCDYDNDLPTAGCYGDGLDDQNYGTYKEFDGGICDEQGILRLPLCEPVLSYKKECDLDWDNDEILNENDNCPEVANNDQTDADENGIGDACNDELDSDGDEWENEYDNCVEINNPGQEDDDNDAIGNACDNCINAFNENQEDTDGDGTADACDNCLNIPNTNQEDPDQDGLGSACDNCPNAANENQEDTDGDGTADACDNCPDISNSEQEDTDEDNVGDICDNCMYHANPDQKDSDYTLQEQEIIIQGPDDIVDVSFGAHKSTGKQEHVSRKLNNDKLILRSDINSINKLTSLWSYIKFDLSKIPEDKEIKEAKLRLYLYSTTTSVGGEYVSTEDELVYVVPEPNNDWDDTTPCTDCSVGQPGGIPSLRDTTGYVDTISLEHSGGLMYVDLTQPIINALKENKEFVSFKLVVEDVENPGDEIKVQFYSTDVTGTRIKEKIPKLTITYFNKIRDGIGDGCDCDDGIKGVSEVCIDSGGICPTQDCCANGYQDEDEGGIDCGGNCALKCFDCFANAEPHTTTNKDNVWKGSVIYDLDNPIVEQTAVQALKEYANEKRVDISEIDTSDEYMEAVVNYVSKHTYWIKDYQGWDLDIIRGMPDSLPFCTTQRMYTSAWGEHRIVPRDCAMPASFIIEQTSSRCWNDYCGDCATFSILTGALLRSLGVSPECVWSSHSSNHAYNIFVYQNKFRLIEPQNSKINSKFRSSRYSSKYATVGLFNDKFGSYAGRDGSAIINPARYTHNYPTTPGTCPSGGWTDKTYYEDVCP